jgi:hypothetical protein
MAEPEEEPREEYPTAELPTEAQEDIFFRSDMYRLFEKLLKDEWTEKKLENFPLWVVGSKDLKLTFFDEREASSLENLFEAEICRYLRSLPPQRQNFETYIQLGQARILFLANVNRSVGTPIQKINERIAILSQWKITTPVEVAPQQKPSIWRRVFG